MKIDFSKGTALHRLYGHTVFAIEAQKQKKDRRFVAAICCSLQCNNKAIDWRDQLKQF